MELASSPQQPLPTSVLQQHLMVSAIGVVYLHGIGTPAVEYSLCATPAPMCLRSVLYDSSLCTRHITSTSKGV